MLLFHFVCFKGPPDFVFVIPDFKLDFFWVQDEIINGVFGLVSEYVKFVVHRMADRANVLLTVVVCIL